MEIEKVKTSKGYKETVIESYAVYMTYEEINNCKDLGSTVANAVLSKRPLKENEDYGFGRTHRISFGNCFHVHIFEKEVK